MRGKSATYRKSEFKKSVYDRRFSGRRPKGVKGSFGKSQTCRASEVKDRTASTLSDNPTIIHPLTQVVLTMHLQSTPSLPAGGASPKRCRAMTTS